MKRTWGSFLYEYVETGWFDHDSRPKTMSAMQEVFEKVPAEILDQLPKLILFAPSPDITGEVYPAGAGGNDGYVFVYLSPQLENLDQQQVSFIVAHELAHVVLKHYHMNNPDTSMSQEEAAKYSYLTSPAESKADRLVESWGFVIPADRHTPPERTEAEQPT